MYRLINDSNVLHIPSGVIFPLPPGESFGHDYQRWLDAGNTPEPPSPPPPTPVPQEVTMRQARLALLNAGLYAAVEAAIDSLPDPPRTAARIEWDFSNTLHRQNDFVAQLAPMLGLTDEQVDDLFIAAAAIPAF